MYILYIYLFIYLMIIARGHWDMFEAGDDLPGLQIMKRQHIQCETWMQTVELARADKSWPGWSYVNHSVKDAPTGYIHNDVVNRDKMHQHIWWYIHPCSFILMYIYIILFTQIYHRLHHLNMSISAMTSCMLPTYPEWFTWKWERLGAFLVPMGIQFQRCQSDIGIDPLLIPSP